MGADVAHAGDIIDVYGNWVLPCLLSAHQLKVKVRQRGILLSQVEGLAVHTVQPQTPQVSG